MSHIPVENMGTHYTYNTEARQSESEQQIIALVEYKNTETKTSPKRYLGRSGLCFDGQTMPKLSSLRSPTNSAPPDAGCKPDLRTESGTESEN